MVAKPTDTEAVESFLAALDHPRKAEILELRRILLDADPSIREGIKGNAFPAEAQPARRPSPCTDDPLLLD